MNAAGLLSTRYARASDSRGPRHRKVDGLPVVPDTLEDVLDHDVRAGVGHQGEEVVVPGRQVRARQQQPGSASGEGALGGRATRVKVGSCADVLERSGHRDRVPIERSVVQPGEVERAYRGLAVRLVRAPARLSQRFRSRRRRLYTSTASRSLSSVMTLPVTGFELLLQSLQPVAVVLELEVLVVLVRHAELEHVRTIRGTPTRRRSSSRAGRWRGPPAGRARCRTGLSSAASGRAGRGRRGRSRSARRKVPRPPSGRHPRRPGTRVSLPMRRSAPRARTRRESSRPLCRRGRALLPETAASSPSVRLSERSSCWSSFDCGRRPVHQPAVRPPSTARH